MSLGCQRKTNESWRECCERYAAAYGLQEEALAVFDTECGAGVPEADACWTALCEWDLLEYRSDDKC
jgi:hypothetical protein